MSTFHASPTENQQQNSCIDHYEYLPVPDQSSSAAASDTTVVIAQPCNAALLSYRTYHEKQGGTSHSHSYNPICIPKNLDYTFFPSRKTRYAYSGKFFSHLRSKCSKTEYDTKEQVRAVWPRLLQLKDLRTLLLPESTHDSNKYWQLLLPPPTTISPTISPTITNCLQWTIDNCVQCCETCNTEAERDDCCSLSSSKTCDWVISGDGCTDHGVFGK